MAESTEDLVSEYQQYLERFDSRLGPCEFGAYAKHPQGRLVKKLRYDEFEGKWNEFSEAEKAYMEILERGDTINDILVKILRERADELVLERKL
jgi:hypothetical protein